MTIRGLQAGLETSVTYVFCNLDKALSCMGFMAIKLMEDDICLSYRLLPLCRHLSEDGSRQQYVAWESCVRPFIPCLGFLRIRAAL